MIVCEVVFFFGCQVFYECNCYLLVIKFNGFLFVLGQVGSYEDGLFEYDLKVQVRLVFKNFNVVFVVVGCMFEDVVDVIFFVVDFELNFDVIWSILLEYWGEVFYFMLIGIGVMWFYGFKFEIKVIVRLF